MCSGSLIDPIPPTVSLSPPSPIQESVVGDPLMIQCTAFTTDIFDVNLVVFTWMGPEGITITNDSRVTIGPTSSNNSAYTSSLQFIYLMERDNGTYMCNVTILTVDGLASVLLEPLTSKSHTPSNSIHVLAAIEAPTYSSLPKSFVQGLGFE